MPRQACRKMAVCVLMLSGFTATLTAYEPGPVEIGSPSPDRVIEIAAMLGDEPIVPRYDDTAFWHKAGQAPYLRHHIKRAEEALKHPTVGLKEFDRLYRRHLDDGNRKAFQDLILPAANCVRLYAFGECIERKGRFLPALNERIRSICSWPTWMLSAHDSKRDNLEGRIVQIDLGVAMRAADLAAVLLVFGERLEPDVIDLVRDNLRRRVLVPHRLVLTGKQKPFHWYRNTNNWSAVCHTGIVLAALAAGKDRDEIAWHLAGVERMNGNFYAGFTADGYCSEGIGYWGYGFGHFIVFSEYIRRATGGQVDLFLDPAAQRAATFPLNIAMVDGRFPAIADCSVDEYCTQPWSWYLARRIGTKDLGEGTQTHPCAGGYNFYGRMPFVDAESIPQAGRSAIEPDPLRGSFPDGGVYVMRAFGAKPFAAAIKAGHNNEHHNHNDIGAFTIVAGGFPLICDPGKEVYTRFTFDRKYRYKSPAHNSYGHPVPKVAGVLQGTGRDFCGTILKHETSAKVDTVVIDLSKAYPVPELRSLTRTLVFDRRKRRITITDQVRFSKPQAFETALVTYATVKRQGDTLSFVNGDAACAVSVASSGAKPVYTTEVLEADWTFRKKMTWTGAHKPTRIGIASDKLITEGSITCTITVP